MSTTYAEKLKDPRWQKKRLERMDKDQWTCRECGSTTTTLSVHNHRQPCHEAREPQLVLLRTAMFCLTANLTAAQIAKLHHALMFKGDVWDSIQKAVVRA